MNTLIEDEVTCATCGQKSRQVRIGQTEACGWPDLDGRPAPPWRSTMEHWLQECPTCGYIAGDITWPAQKTVHKPEPGRRLSDMLTDSPLAARFVQYAGCLSYEGNSSGACDYFLYAAWVYDDLKKATRARTMRRFALDFIHDPAGSIIRNERRRYLLLKADLLRRMGRFSVVLALNEKDDALTESDRRQLLWEKELALLEDEAAHSLVERPGLFTDDN